MWITCSMSPNLYCPHTRLEHVNESGLRMRRVTQIRSLPNLRCAYNELSYFTYLFDTPYVYLDYLPIICKIHSFNIFFLFFFVKNYYKDLEKERVSNWGRMGKYPKPNPLGYWTTCNIIHRSSLQKFRQIQSH